MRGRSGIIRLVVILMLSSLVLSGCFLRTTIGSVGPVDDGGLIVSFGADSTTAMCVREEIDEATTVLECTYWLIDFSDELVFEVISTVELISQFGLFGVLVDPVILQVPEDATNVTGTYRYFNNDASQWVGPESLIITETDSFAADASTTVAAESGQKFLIIELPDDVAGLIPDGDARVGTQFFFELEFELETARPIEVKPMYSVRVDVGDDTFYVPMAPCVTDFADVPGVDLPEGGFADLYQQVLDAFTTTLAEGTHVCDGAVYDFDQDGSQPPSPPPVDNVVIDVKPASDGNPINPRSKGVIPVAILTTSVEDGDASDSDATNVDPATLQFGPDGASIAHDGRHHEDVDNDGDMDLVVHFFTRESGIACGDTSVTLSGSTVDGDEFEGTDTIRTVGCR